MVKVVTPKRRGSRGCPGCGSHNTDNIRTVDGIVCVCVDCRHRWQVCKAFCRGYRVAMSPVPHVIGCPDCGVPDSIATWWPEAHRAVANELDEVKAAAFKPRGA